MRGVVPIGVTAPRGATSVTLSPTRNDNWSASRRPDRHALPGVKAFERALLDVVGDGGQLGEIGGAHAAHQHAATH